MWVPSVINRLPRSRFEATVVQGEKIGALGEKKSGKG